MYLDFLQISGQHYLLRQQVFASGVDLLHYVEMKVEAELSCACLEGVWGNGGKAAILLT